jgi:hypothetical protein
MTTTIPRRLGAAALAAATIASGLGFATPATASPTTTGTTPVTATGTTPVTLEGDEVTRLVGPLAILDDANTIYGMSLDADTLRTKTAKPLPEAVAESDWFSVPALNATGPVRGVGDKADWCVEHSESQNILVGSCNGASNQDWTWAKVASIRGFDLTLSPANNDRGLQPRGAGTWVRTMNLAELQRPVTASNLVTGRSVTAEVTVDWASRTATITGVATSGSTVSAEGATPVTADETTGAYTLTVPGLAFGDNEITVTQTLPNGVAYGETTVTATLEQTERRVGPLALIESAETAYGLSMDSDALRTKSATTIAQALVDSDYLSVPTPGQVGPVTGVGEKADRCLTWGAGTDLGAGTCTGANNQKFTWVTVPTLQGATQGLAPADGSNRAVRARGEGTYANLRTGDSRRPMVLTTLADSRDLTADVTVDRTSQTATITGVATANAIVSAPGAQPVLANATTGAYTLTVPGLAVGDNEITVTQTLPNGTPYGDTVVTATITSDITPVEVPNVDLVRGATTDVTFVVSNSAAQQSFAPTATLTAPEGTTFAPTTNIKGQYRLNGSETWQDSNGLTLNQITLSDDRTTMTATAPASTVGGNAQFRYAVPVVTPTNAAAGQGGMGYTYEGTSAVGPFRAVGIAPTTIAPATELAVTNPNAEQIAAGYTPNTSYTFEGTGNTGSTITIQNAKGIEFATVPVEDGTWEWTRNNMGTYTWILDFIQDKGTPTEKTVRMSGFKPAS